VAPVFDRATRVRGRVSAEIDSAFLPIGGSNGLAVEGTVVFQNVEFLPGPFADPLMELIGRKDRPLVRLDEPVELAIADRRVYQKGLTIPIGRLTKIGIEGWVDFDRHLNLVASVPIVPSGLADKPVIGEIAGAAVIRVPIRGTMQDPQVDREAFKIGMKEMGQSVLEKGLTRGVPGLLDLITRPRDPNAPPPPPPLTREERKARQLERRAERRRRRGLEP
jgi:translocation and assembly module TamB